MTAPLAKLEGFTDVRFRIGSAIPRNPSRVPESHKCLLCALQEAIKSLEYDGQNVFGATVVLVTAGIGSTPQEEIDVMYHLAILKGIRVEIIFYPLLETSTTNLKKTGLDRLARATGGSISTVMDEGVGNDSKINMMIGLMDSMLTAVQRTAHNTPIVVHKQTYPGGHTSLSKGSFFLDDSLGEDAQFAVYYYDINHVGNTIELTSPSGIIMSSINMQEEDGDANIIFVDLPSAERGVWQYQVENRADSHQSLHIQVTSKESSTRKIKLKLWTNSPNNTINIQEPFSPVIIYAELSEGYLPVLRSKVVAKLQKLGTNTTGTPYEPIYFDLYDEGFGGSDLTSGDGIYSRYLPYDELHGNTGLFELSVTADDNEGISVLPAAYSNLINKNHEPCCSSVLRYNNLRTISAFYRSSKYGTLKIVSQTKDEDMFPPSRITDLRAHINNDRHELTLLWTAPGGDYDFGHAEHYEAVIASSWNEANVFSGEFILGMPKPVTVGTEQSIKVFTEKFGQIIYISIYALDQSGNKGTVSNIVSVWVPLPPSTDAPFISTAPLAVGELQGHGLIRSDTGDSFNFDDMAAIIGSVVGFLIVLGVILIFCFVYALQKRSRHNKKEKEITKNKIYKMPPTIIDTNESHDSADSGVKDCEALNSDGRSLSPTNSWTATQLLYEHEKRFSTTSAGKSNSSEFQEKEQYSDIISYPESQTCSETATAQYFEPPSYQASYIEGQSSHPYYDPCSQDDLPPYTPQAQAAPCEILHNPPIIYNNQLVQPIDIYSEAFVRHSQTDNISENYANLQNDIIYTHGSMRRKFAPPVAPKPTLAVRNAAVAAATAAGLEPKRRNVTQV
ncbi:unnamed protein product [Meganyctiphanes norvegica]|uniref:Uncharacterized protein n=1 Tax=Meganyctiphanes norvegica TaxID=48144 RepID=A0AAV2S701_MEGNR